MFRYLFTIAIFLLTANSWSASHHPQVFLTEITGSKTEGEQIVQHYCALCHAKKPMIQLGAPIIGQAKAWEPRIKQGIDALLKNCDEGLSGMPPRGGCFECSDKQLWLAIMAMIPEDLHAKITVKGS